MRTLNEQSGPCKSGSGNKNKGNSSRQVVYGSGLGKGNGNGIGGDSGGAARFFYVAKSSRAERDAGLSHLPPKSGGEATGRVDGSVGTENPRAGAGRTGGARNVHPTVKNIALMRWLIRLITPPGGVILDPFAGSGSTGVAALAEGCRFIGCELADEYIPLIEGRLQHALAA